MRPNILWLTIEDTSPQFVGCYGEQAARTPVIDALCADGVRFDHAYSVGTVCSPSRSALITGVPPWELGTGHHRSAYPIPDEVTAFPALLRGVGYHTSNNAKTDYNTSSEARLVAEGWDRSAPDTGWWERTPGQPFFAVRNFMSSHQSWTMSLPYEIYRQEHLSRLSAAEVTSDDGFEVPPFFRDSPAMRRQLARVHNSLTVTDNEVGAVLDRLERDGLHEDTIVFFFADHGQGIPRGKTNGIGLGCRVPLIVRLPPRWRHLSPWAPGSSTQEPVSFLDLVVTVLALTGAPVPDRMPGRAVLGDLRSPSPAYLFAGRDRTDESTDLERMVIGDGYLYTRHYLPYLAEMQWMKYQEVSDIKQVMRHDLDAGLLDPTQRRLFAPRPAESLYHLESDPWEVTDLASDPEHQTRLQTMREALQEHLVRSRDVHFLPEYELVRIARTCTAYEYRTDDDRYPVARILDAAGLSGFRGRDVADRQASLLAHDSCDVVRYWAVVGLRSQSAETLEPHRQALRASMADAYPPVAIAAAGLCHELGDDPDARALLDAVCRGDDPTLVHLALEQIQNATNVAAFADTVEHVAAPGQRDAYNLAAIIDTLRWRLGRAALEPIR